MQIMRTIAISKMRTDIKIMLTEKCECAHKWEMKKPVYKCACGAVFKPRPYPEWVTCKCGAKFMVEKPGKENEK
jgi:hypothetical protein